jgi:hypothetical protein
MGEGEARRDATLLSARSAALIARFSSGEEEGGDWPLEPALTVSPVAGDPAVLFLSL